MSSGVAGDRRVTDRDGACPVVACHEYAAAEGARARCVAGDCVAAEDDVGGRSAVLVDGAAVAARADFVLAVVALMPPVCCGQVTVSGARFAARPRAPPNAGFARVGVPTQFDSIDVATCVVAL